MNIFETQIGYDLGELAKEKLLTDRKKKQEIQLFSKSALEIVGSSTYAACKSYLDIGFLYKSHIDLGDKVLIIFEK